MFEDDIVIVQCKIKTRLERRSTTAPAPNKSELVRYVYPAHSLATVLARNVDWLYITDYRLRAPFLQSIPMGITT